MGGSSPSARPLPNAVDGANDEHAILDSISQTKLLEDQLQGGLERHTVQVDSSQWRLATVWLLEGQAGQQRS